MILFTVASLENFSMFQRQRGWQIGFWAGAIALLPLIGWGYAEPSNGQTASKSELNFGTPRPRPSRRARGGSRGCPTNQPLIPLVPQAAEQGGQTVAAFPTFWIQVPYRLTSTNTIRLELLDSAGNVVYRTTFNAPATDAGIIGVVLPSAAPALVVGESYEWAVLISCDAVPDVRAVATGWVQRVELEPSLSRQIAAAAPVERSHLYATRAIWYDALTVLAEERRRNPGDRLLTEHWNRLLSLPSVGLDAVTTAPLIPCCVLPATQ